MSRLPVSWRPVSSSWKFDVTLLDLSGYSSDGALLHRTEDDRLVVRIHSSSESGLYDDFYVQEPRSTELQSMDGGVSWEPSEGQFPLSGVVTAEGKRLYIWNEMLKGERLQEHLGNEGLGHLYRPGAQMMHRLYPGERRAELEAQGLFMFDAFEGLVATLPEIVLLDSDDDGATWSQRKMEQAPDFAWICGWHQRRGLVLDDGTLLGAVYGLKGHTDAARRVWITRSIDGGRTWTFTQLYQDGSDPIGIGETCLTLLPSGRVMAMSRPHFADRHAMCCTFSDDGGRTWTRPKQVPFWGYPPHVIVLENGDVMVSYAYRRHPFGIRACISHDEGETWDVENEKIIRDDSLPKGVGYPESTQLSDGSLFTVWAMSKIAALKPEDAVAYGKTLTLHPWFHTFVGGSRYSLDYVRPRGQAVVLPDGVHPRRKSTLGTDAIAYSAQR